MEKDIVGHCCVVQVFCFYLVTNVYGTYPTSLTRPSFESQWHTIRAQNTAHKNLTIIHNFGEYPALVDVQIKIHKNGKDYIFTGIGSAHRDDDANNPYGGTVYIYNKINIFLTFPLKDNNFESGGIAYTGSHKLYNGPSELEGPYMAGMVKVRAWRNSDMPKLQLNMSVYVDNSANSYKEITHSLGFYPDIVSVRTHLGNGYVSDAQGTALESCPCHMGGVIYGYDHKKIRLWVATGSKHGPFSIVDGWGGSSDWSINGTVDILAWKMDNFHRSFQTVFTVTKNSSTQSCLQFQDALDLNNFLISVKVGIPTGNSANSGMVFNVVGSSMASGVNPYGGIVYAYTTDSIMFWNPNGEKGHLVYIGGIWGHGLNSESADVVDVNVIVYHLTDIQSNVTQTCENTTTEEPLTTDHTYSEEITITPTTTENHFSSRLVSTPSTTTTTKQTTTSATQSPTPCIGGGLNRTDATLDEECGTHGEDAKCNVSNSACTETSIASTWRCRCVQGYAKKSDSCQQLPTKLFKQESQKVSINLTESSPIGHQVLREHFTEVDGFYKTTPTAEIWGPGSDSFSLSTVNTANVGVIVSNSAFPKSKYDIFVVVSVTVDGIVIRDFIHVAITITRTNIIEKNIFVIDGTPKDSVVGLVCQSCLSGDVVTTISPDDSVSAENDGSIKTTTNINLDTIGGSQTIAYSSYIQVKQNDHLVANITILIVRLRYNQTLTEGSGRYTSVGLFKLSIPYSIHRTELALINDSLMLGSVSLDYHTEKEVHKPIMLSVSGAAINIQIIINVLDVNNKAPVFLGAPYRFVTVQSAYTDLTLGVVTAFDLDIDAHLTYAIIPSDKLSINNNGVITIHSQFDPGSTIYNANVTVRDGIYYESEEITVDIRKAANDELDKTFNGTILENEDDKVIVTVNVSKYENYRFADKSTENDFTIDSKTGEIRNKRAFDREKEQEFKLTILASKENEAECSLVVIGVVTISVTDVNDEPPIFVGAPYNATVVEEDPYKEVLVVPSISTTDNDINQTVFYSILTNGDKFAIDEKTGAIKTKVAIDREKYPSLDIEVNAFDGIHNNKTSVFVKIIDINDNDPEITRSKSYNVSEGSPVGTSVGLMTASDADEGENAKITFDLITNGGYFRINQMTGNILVSRQLDREAVAIHHMTVYARDNGNIIRISSATVTVTLDDVNDNEPVFAQDQVIVSFQENRSCANSILTITASDADMVNTPNSQIEYFFIRGGDNFMIDQQSGILKCKVALDYEQKVSYEIIVEARDKGSPYLSSAQTVIVQVIDVNDNSPIFVDIKSQIIIRYLSPGRVVEVFKATDIDSGENGKVHFSIRGNATQFLQIGKVDGILRTKKNAFTPKEGEYYLNVTVTDNGIKPLTNTTSLVVIVQKLIEQSIKFNVQEINMTIQENRPLNSSVKSVLKNVINTENKTLMFDIIDESGDLSFSLHRDTGMVNVFKDVDRELKEIHEFVIRVRNTENAEQSDLALVRVKIGDENDNEPVFVKNEYFFKIFENEPIGTVLSPPGSEIIATDADSGENALIEFKLYGEECVSAFTLKHERLSTMSIELAEKVDYELIQKCKFTVEAFNPNERKMKSTVSVDINIFDYNDNVPEFEGHTNYVYNITVPEDTNINTNLLSFGRVTDKDSNENKDIELSIVNDDCWFTVNIDDEDMFLKVKHSITLDFESNIVQNICTLNASDKGAPRLSTTATLNISITDVNDNSPNIPNPDIILNVSRDADPGTVIVDRIPATDIDSGVNGMLVYKLEPSEHSSRFAIDVNTGQITVNNVLQSVQKDTIMLTVIVSDKGSPQRSTRAQVTIKIKDDNPRPFFVVQSMSVDIQEHTNKDGGILGEVVAYDRRDSGEINDCDCTYLLDTKRDDIIIDRESGVIKFRYSNHTLDREGEDFEQVIVGVIATDKGEHPKNSSTMEFKIKITDINDQVPVFNQINYEFDIFQYAPNGTYIGEVNAVDLDENPETLYYINITESSVGSVVTIDKETGKIVKAGNMSLSSAQNVQIKGNVFAQDGKDRKKLPSHAEIIITIAFDDKNNHTPVFQQDEYQKDVDWNTAAGSNIVTVNAEDADEGKEGEVTLSIIGGNSRDFFAIQMVKDESYVVLKYQLDSSIGDDPTVIVNLTIKAEDNGIIPKSSYANVKLRVFGQNPGACIQGAEHSKELLNIESERDKWSNALYGLVAALCLAILLSFVFLYKWRTSPVSETTPPVGKMKYFDNPIPYDHLRKRETVEYSHSNESFDPPSRNCDFSDDKDQYQRVTEPEGEARYRRPPDNKHLHSSRPLSFEEPTPDYPVYEFEGKLTKPAIPSTSRTSENC